MGANQFAISRSYNLGGAPGSVLDAALFPAAVGAPVGLRNAFINAISFIYDGAAIAGTHLEFTALNGTAGQFGTFNYMVAPGATFKNLELSGINVGVDASAACRLINDITAAATLRFTLVYSLSP